MKEGEIPNLEAYSQVMMIQERFHQLCWVTGADQDGERIVKCDRDDRAIVVCTHTMPRFAVKRQEDLARVWHELELLTRITTLT